MSEREDTGRPGGTRRVGPWTGGQQPAPPHHPGHPGLADQGTERLDAPRQDTAPRLSPSPADRTVSYPAGYTPVSGHGYAGPEAGPTSPDYSSRPVAVRRPDALGGLLLLLAGVAAGVSLLLRWLEGDDATGLDLVRRGFDDLAVDLREPLETGFWQPLAVVLGGAVLFLLALLLFLPARRHRFVGLLALLVAGVVTAAVLVPLWRGGWDLAAFGLGFWFAMAVAALGLLGALKALFTGRKYR